MGAHTCRHLRPGAHTQASASRTGAISPCICGWSPSSCATGPGSSAAPPRGKAPTVMSTAFAPPHRRLHASSLCLQTASSKTSGSFTSKHLSLAFVAEALALVGPLAATDRFWGFKMAFRATLKGLTGKGNTFFRRFTTPESLHIRRRGVCRHGGSKSRRSVQDETCAFPRSDSHSLRGCWEAVSSGCSARGTARLSSN